MGDLDPPVPRITFVQFAAAPGLREAVAAALDRALDAQPAMLDAADALMAAYDVLEGAGRRAGAGRARRGALWAAAAPGRAAWPGGRARRQLGQRA